MSLHDDPGFPLLVRRLEGQGLPPLAMYKDRCLRRRLAVRMRACGVQTLSDYVVELDQRPGEIARLLQTLTINVTRFFRNRESWERLAVELAALPARRVTAWSAGCATGEEAYSLAMLLCDREGSGHSRVDATDVDTQCLAVAREGWYRAAAFEEAPAGMVARWSDPEREGRRVGQAIRDSIRWLRHDLGSEGAPTPPYDIVVCRNVVIYFERPAQERLYAIFARALRPGGLLMLGKVEVLYGAARDLFEPVDTRERIYRRVGP